MAGTSNNDFANGAPFYLDPNQQDLLLAALASNSQNPNDLFATGVDGKSVMNRFQFPQADNLDPAYFASPEDGTPPSNFNGNINIDESPFVDYLDGDGSFDLDNADTTDLMIGALPGDNGPNSDEHEGNEKRKIPEDEADDPDGGGKRREPEDKTAKKPGRKPLTSEPTTVSVVVDRLHPVANRISETKGSKPSSTTRVQGAKGEASQRSRI